MQNFYEIFKDANVRASLTQFTDAHINRLEASLFDKNGKTTLKCLVTGKDKIAKPEEVIRQLWLLELTETYGYPTSRIQIEYPITFGRDTSKRADIVVMDADHADTPYIIVEVKAAKLKDGKEQLRSYTHAKGAPLALWSNGALAVIWHRKNPNYFVEIPDLPKVTQTIDDIAGQPWTIDVLIDIENKRMAEGNRTGLVSAAKVLIEPGDVLMNGTGVGTIGRSAPYLHTGKAIPDNHVTILRPKNAAVDPVYLSVFINSLAGQFQVEQRLHGSSGQIELYPTDIAEFTVWLAPKAIQQEIRQAVENGFTAKQRATQLLEAAKRAVEIAIEDSETAALAYLAAFS
jgi:hypothetical protein